MKYLYLYLNIGTFIIPFIFSFHAKFQFYKKWKSLFLAILIMMAFFISWDIIFTKNGIWGFNETYITGYTFLNLPIEEWLFFVCIPYACLFTHYALNFIYKGLVFTKKTTQIIYVTLISVLIISLWYYYSHWYTLVNFSYAILLLGLVFNVQPMLLEKFLPTFLIILLPFFIVNGILTGSFIENEVVWYNTSEIVNIKIFTIPIEDVVYALSMLLTVFVLVEYFESKKEKPTKL